MPRVFKVLTGGIFDGKAIQAGAAVWPGQTVKLNTSGSSVDVGDASTVHGFAFGSRYQAYRPTTQQFQIADPMTMVWGPFEALMSADYFTSGSLPSAGDTLYAAASGLLATSGSVALGTCLRVTSYTDQISGTGVSTSIAHVRLNVTR